MEPASQWETGRPHQKKKKKGLLQEGEHFDQISKHLNRQKKALLLLGELVSP